MPADTRATVLLVEDDTPTRERIARAIESHPRLRLLRACGSVEAAKAWLDETAPDVLLTDLGLPDGSGIELIAFARKRCERIQAMVVTVLGDEETVLRAIEAGATGYLLKDGTQQALGDAIAELLDGGSPISAPIARLLLRRVASRNPEAAGVTASTKSAPSGERGLLTQREHEVLNLVGKGFSFPEIARLLGVSLHTVTTHVRHIYEKLEVSSRGEAVFEAVQQGLIRLG
jgi:DNA-binding NarL/FixJ family response regulator